MCAGLMGLWLIPSAMKTLVIWRIRADGASHIFLALSTNDNNTLDKSNKIVPADPQQNRVPLVEKAVDGGIFTYYIGYVTPAPEKRPAVR